jgi:G3E family GTPase
MATYIDVITGFLESGKTTFIKEIIQKDCFMEYEKSVLIVCEEGFEEYNQKALEKQKIKTVMVEDNSELSEQLFANIKQTYSPDYILVEYNGTWNIESLFCLKLPFSYHIRNVLFLSDADKFEYYLGNMTSLMQPQLLNSDAVVFNRFETLSKEKKRKLCGDIKNINKRSVRR